MESFKSNVKEYFKETTVHGFQYVVTGRNRCEKIFWIILIVTGFMMSGIMIYNSISSWRNTPLQTTIEKVSKPIQNFLFPGITICNQDQLQMPRRNRWMFVEQVLNWIDISSLDSNETPSEVAKVTEETFQLKSLRRKLGDQLEYHFYKPFRKSCFDQTYFQYCGTILEYLVLQEDQSIEEIIEVFYDETLKHWDGNYPPCDRRQNRKSGYNVMKEALFPIYENIYLDKHTKLKSNVTNDKIDILFKCNSFNNRSKCENTIQNIEILWEKLENRIRFTSICNLGSLVSNVNFLLDDWKYVKAFTKGMEIKSSKDSKVLHHTISETMKKLYPDLLIDNIAFLDTLGLLGYSTDTDFASIDNLFFKSLEYQAMSSTLRPLYSFSNTVGQFKGTQRDVGKQVTCNLNQLYKEWMNCMFYRQDNSKVKGEKNDNLNHI